MKHVILGAGPAGVIAAETIRKHAPNDEIVIIGDEPEAPYSRMAIPYLLIGKVGEEGTHLRHGADHFGKLRITLQRGRAQSVDIQQRCVVLADGSRVAFDKLLIATGARHRWPWRAPLLDPGRRTRHHGAGPARRAGAADGRRLHRLHHHGIAGDARCETERG